MERHSIGASDAAACIVLAAVVVILYHGVLRLWWTYDDGYLLHVAIVSRPWQYFADAALWHSMPGHMFVPLLPATYDSVLGVFGLAVERWHAFELSLVALFAVCWYAVLRLWFPVSLAFAGALLAVAGTPFCSVAAQLMLSHYLESVILAALATFLYVRYSRGGPRWQNTISACAYLGSMLAKEIAAPLMIVLFLLPERDMRARIRAGVPHAMALTLYIVWRIVMLGTPIGGYGWAIRRSDVPAALAALPMRMARAIGGPSWFLGTALLAVVLIGAGAALRMRRAILASLAMAILVVAPIFPVSKEFQTRYAIAAWLLLTIMFVIGCSGLRNRWFAAALGVAAISLTLACNREEWSVEYSKDMRMSVEGRAFFTLPATAVLRNPAVPPAAMGELRWIKEHYQHRPGGTAWFYDDLFLCDGRVGGKRVWQYRTGQMVEITGQIPSLRQAYCGAIRSAAPLTAQFHHEGDTLSWRFGPYTSGAWRVVIGDGVQAFDVPASDAFHLGDLPGISLRIRYASPEGWVTYSPEMSLDFNRHPDLAWHR